MNSRNQSLDVLRAVAVMLAIFCHYAYFRIMTAGWVESAYFCTFRIFDLTVDAA